ncbi:MAG: acyltransferase [Nocardiopsaceae bacterium]|jgi:peptidoglycan/LPS O-acetylase OafA/YrhL|nr:acyltransferase [Nocardiopsaceae bacterium]
MNRVGGFRRLAERIAAATPADRDRSADALRALAIAGVILGHWMVTALVATHAGASLYDASPLAALPALTPVTWVFQTLAIFFLVGGYAAALSSHGSYGTWLRKRLTRLSKPVAVLAVPWAVVASALYASGVSPATLRVLLTLILDPLWFLGVFAVLTAATPLAVALVRRLGAWAAMLPLLVVAAVDSLRFGMGGPAWFGWINVMAGWLVPYLIGIAWAHGAFRGWKAPAVMLAGGVAATVALVSWAGYPASMVGVNGAAISNLNPPTLAAVTFGIAQAGLALLARPLLARWMRRPAAWAMVAIANMSAMTLFLWHQTAFIAVTMTGLLIGRLPGLLTAPDSFAWVVERLAWLPVFAVILAALWALFRRAERPRTRRRNPPGPIRANAEARTKVPERGTNVQEAHDVRPCPSGLLLAEHRKRGADTSCSPVCREGERNVRERA